MEMSEISTSARIIWKCQKYLQCQNLEVSEKPTNARIWKCQKNPQMPESGSVRNISNVRIWKCQKNPQMPESGSVRKIHKCQNHLEVSEISPVSESGSVRKIHNVRVWKCQKCLCCVLDSFSMFLSDTCAF